jgi:hypothetical protein
MTESHPIPPFPAEETAGCQCHQDAGAAPPETEACMCHLDSSREPQANAGARASETEARAAAIRERRKEPGPPLPVERAGWLAPALRVALVVPVLALGLALVVTGLTPVLFVGVVLLLPALVPLFVALLGIAATLEDRPAKVMKPETSGTPAAPASVARLASSRSAVGV